MNNTVLKKTIFNVMGLVGVAALSNFSQAASFDCAKAAAPIEKLICSDEATSKLYADLAAVYNLGDGNHGRHFAEAQVFGLYLDSLNVSDAEAL